MKTNITKRIKVTFSLLAVLCAAFSVNAQKQSDIQANSVLSPDKIKIDGKLTEWSDFQAFNKTTLLNYTLSNDDKNLYLAIKSIDPSNNSKIMMGGISFIVNTDGKKKEKDGFIVTYPVIDQAAMRAQGGQRGQGNAAGGGRPQAGAPGGQFGQGQQSLTPKQRDSMTLVRNTQQLASVKEIKVIGFKDIPDSLISIYNEFGVKAVASFDASGAFQYELAIPLKSLGLSADKPKEFAYSIKVNGRQLGGGGFGGGQGAGGGGAGGPGGGGDRQGGGGGFGGGNNLAMFTPTDFWGKYILAKK